MNILMVNPVHPSTPHVSAVRAWRFAQELARRGHRTVFLTGSSVDQVDADIPILETHDWRKPFVCSIPLATEGQFGSPMPRWLDKVRTAACMVLDGGRRRSWVTSAVEHVARINDVFRPTVVWCTLGSLEAAFVSKRVAARLKCPWVLDVKDMWEFVVPQGLRRIMAWRTRGWAAATANARTTAEAVVKWLGVVPSVIYSGIDERYYPDERAAPSPSQEFAVNLIGSIYFPSRLSAFVEGLADWMEDMPEASRRIVRVRYLGADDKVVWAAALQHQGKVPVETTGFVSVDEVARCCKAAAMNVYIGYPGAFHHKLLELLACGRPVMAVGSETAEAEELARETQATLSIAPDSIAVRATVESVFERWTDRSFMVASGARLRQFDWSTQAQALELVLTSAVGQRAAR